mgnify:CR=1 FL=1
MFTGVKQHFMFKIFTGMNVIVFFFIQEKEKVEFSETVNSYDDKLTFQDMNVSRPLMKVKI